MTRKNINSENKTYGDFEVEDDLDFKKAKVKVTLYLDGDVLDMARKESAKKHTKYQALINQVLREVLLSEQAEEDRLRKLEERVSLLEAGNL